MILLQSFGSGLAQLFFPLAILFVFYFFIYRPDQKRKQKQSNFISSLKKGKKVVTMGGIHGKFSSMRRLLENDEKPLSTKIYRIWNEVPAVLMILIVFMAIVKPL